MQSSLRYSQIFEGLQVNVIPWATVSGNLTEIQILPEENDGVELFNVLRGLKDVESIRDFLGGIEGP